MTEPSPQPTGPSRARNLTPLDDAVAALCRQLAPILTIETVALRDCAGRVLAADIVASSDQPPFDSVAVDGFALCAQDLRGAARLAIANGRALAGMPYPRRLEPGEAVRVMTGAKLPDGADHVVMQEHCLIAPATVAVRQVTRKSNIRRRAEEFAAATKVLSAHARLRPEDVALLAAAGVSSVPAFRRARVGVASTGEEVREPGQPLRDGQIWDANRYMLTACLTRLGCEILDLGILPDRPQALEQALTRAAPDLDLLITTGGISVGSEDHMRTVIGRRGSLDLWRVAIKPGQSIGVGDIDDCPILALPGNPVAAYVAFMTLGKAAVDTIAQATARPHPPALLPAAFTLDSQPGYRQFLPASIAVGDDGSCRVARVAQQGTAMTSALAALTGFVVLSEDCTTVRPGDLVAYRAVESYFH